MKKLILILVGCFAMQVAAQSNLTASQWQEDVKFLQNTIHQDYNFLFKKISAKEFDAMAEELYQNVPNMQEHEIVVGLAKLVSSFKYGHTVLGFRYQEHVEFHQLPVNLYQYNDGVYIQGIHKDYASALGSKVLEIAGVPIEKALDMIAPVVPSENSQFFKAYAGAYLTSPEVLHAQGIIPNLTNEISFTLEKDGKPYNQIFSSLPKGQRVPTQYSHVIQDSTWLDARDQSTTPNYLKNLEKIYYFEYLPDSKTVYIRHSQIQDDPSENVPTFYDRVFDFVENNDVEKLVLDVRLNGGGNNYKNKDIVTRVIKSEKINQVGKFFVIIGRRTFSACQNLVNELDNYTNVIFVGEPSSENVNFYGDNQRVELPNSKIPAYLSFAWWQDKPQWENADWMAPHLAIDMSFEQYRTNQDPVLDAALGFDGKDFILDPMEYMTNLFLAGEIEKLQTEVPKMVRDSKYRFFDFESNLNKAGYQLLDGGQNKNAIFVFQFITNLFPDSANAWDSLAEGFLRSGSKEKAVELYKKALEMDPNGPTGKNALQMLKSIENGEH